MCLGGLHRETKVSLEHPGRKKSPEREATGNALQGLENNAGLKGENEGMSGHDLQQVNEEQTGPVVINGAVHEALLKYFWFLFPTEKAAKGLKGKANFHRFNQI